MYPDSMFPNTRMEGYLSQKSWKNDRLKEDIEIQYNKDDDNVAFMIRDGDKISEYDGPVENVLTAFLEEPASSFLLDERIAAMLRKSKAESIAKHKKPSKKQTKKERKQKANKSSSPKKPSKKQTKKERKQKTKKSSSPKKPSKKQTKKTRKTKKCVCSVSLNVK